MQKWNWNIAIFGGVLFCFIFFFQGLPYPLQQTSGHTGLLFFMIPGVVSAYLSRREGLLHALLGTLLALPVCIVIRLAALSSYERFVDLVVYFLGAVFWCGLGTLLYIFGSRILQYYKLRMRQQHRSHGH